MFGFAPTTSLADSVEKLGTDPWIGQRRTVDSIGSPDSQEQWDCSTLLMTHERLPHMGTARRKCTPGIRGLAWELYMACWSSFPLQGVHRFESPRLSDMSNLLFVAFIT
jgi:hypothetical protein